MRAFLLVIGTVVAMPAVAAFPDSILRSGLEACPVPSQYCPDVDQDTFGDTAFCVLTCEPPYDFSLSAGGDCNNDFASINPAAAEICNGTDDDCDVDVDEGNPGGGGSCTSGFAGVCSAGTRVCFGGALQCLPNVAPGSMQEACNGLDDDCDNDVDENNPGGGGQCTRPGFLGICQFGTQTCSSGALLCVGPEPGSVQEVCNGQDDDCNGTIDDPALLSGAVCQTPFPGICANGTTMCVNGSNSCVPNVAQGSVMEVCNGVDDDCDFGIDEDFPGSGSTCNTGLGGLCGSGTQSCQGGLVICVPPPGC